ncbi:MAG: cytochrome bc complex cytochrome b subunit [Betaproteobacteria bacterium]|nr:cytochrome bc complex cytochrome b subunit [Betaproteobacteria bacterium]
MALWNWIDARMPSLAEEYRKHLAEYYAPKNFNFWYYFGSLAMLVLAIQIVTGIFLTMHYKPDANLAFGSVEYIMRDVWGGWIIRYIHSTGASAFFIVVYLHMFRGLIYGSYRQPRELIWIFGVLIYLCLMGEAFMGYLLPWGQMSYWGAQVIVNLFGTIPFVGPDLALWIRGDFVVSDATLNRFFAMHVIALPLVLLGLVVVHLLALHDVGSNNPDGIEIKKQKDPETGHPLDVMFFAPELGGYFLEYNNFIPADPLKTPLHIAPLWYFTPFYTILRAVPPLFNSQFPGVLAMGIAVLIFFFLPWLDRSPVKSIRYRGPLYKGALAIFVVAFLVLGYLGTEPTTVWGQFGFDAFFLDTKEIATWVGRLGTVIYFLFFFLMPWYTARDKCRPVPDRVTM